MIDFRVQTWYSRQMSIPATTVSFQRFINSVNAAEANEFIPPFPETFLSAMNEPLMDTVQFKKFLANNKAVATRGTLDSFLALSEYCQGIEYHSHAPQDGLIDESCSAYTYRAMLFAFAQNEGFEESIFFDILKLTPAEQNLYSQDSKILNFFLRNITLTDAALPALDAWFEVNDKFPFHKNVIKSKRIQDILMERILNGSTVSSELINHVISSNSDCSIDDYKMFINLNKVQNSSMLCNALADNVPDEITHYILETGEMSNALLGKLAAQTTLLDKLTNSEYAQNLNLDVSSLLVTNLERIFASKEVTQTMLIKVHQPIVDYLEAEAKAKAVLMGYKRGIPTYFDSMLKDKWLMAEMAKDLSKTLGIDMTQLPGDWALKMWMKANSTSKVKIDS